MNAEQPSTAKNICEITPEMLQAGYAVIGEFDPDITCLAPAEAVNAMLKAVYVAMNGVGLGVDMSSAIQAGLALRPAED